MKAEKRKVNIQVGIENDDLFVEVSGHRALLPDNLDDLNKEMIFMTHDNFLVCFTTYNDSDLSSYATALSKLIREVDVERCIKTKQFHLGSIEDFPLENVPLSWKESINENCSLYGKDTRVLVRMFVRKDDKYVPAFYTGPKQPDPDINPPQEE